MNDIEVLEELLQNIKRVNENTLDCEIKEWLKEAQAIENLLKERQSDKERIEELEENYSILENAYFTDNIPKSLIEEKIEEIKEKIEEAELEKDVTLYSFISINQIKMRALEELLNTKM